jgi:hypothetical protein
VISTFDHFHHFTTNQLALSLQTNFKNIFSAETADNIGPELCESDDEFFVSEKTKPIIKDLAHASVRAEKSWRVSAEEKKPRASIKRSGLAIKSCVVSVSFAPNLFR